jgi:rod shape-determining protein MreD
MSDRTPGIRPRPTLWRRLDVAARHAFPAGTTLFMMLLATAPFGLPGQAQLLPALALCCVFFWSVFRPVAMSPPVVFVIGLFADLVGLAPPGVMVFTLLLVHAVALRLRRVLSRQRFPVVWMVFGFCAAATALLDWALYSGLTLRLLPPGPLVFQLALSVALYPALATLLTRAHRGPADPDRA